MANSSFIPIVLLLGMVVIVILSQLGGLQTGPLLQQIPPSQVPPPPTHPFTPQLAIPYAQKLPLSQLPAGGGGGLVGGGLVGGGLVGGVIPQHIGSALEIIES